MKRGCAALKKSSACQWQTEDFFMTKEKEIFR